VDGLEVWEEEALAGGPRWVAVGQGQGRVNEAEEVSAESEVGACVDERLEVLQCQDRDADGGGVVDPLEVDKLYLS
jgi:hypothetical protein